MKDKIEGKTSRENGEKPLAGKHVRLDAGPFEVIVQFGQLIFHQPIQLVQTKVELLEMVFVQIAEAIVVHEGDQNTECFFFGHLKGRSKEHIH